MSTSYYFKINNADIKKQVYSMLLKCYSKETLDNFIEDNGWGVLDFKIHIGTRTSGSRPLFEKTKYYSSVTEILDFYEKNKENLIIVTEYDQSISIEELKNELIDWAKNNTSVSMSAASDYIDPEGYEFSSTPFE